MSTKPLATRRNPITKPPRRRAGTYARSRVADAAHEAFFAWGFAACALLLAVLVWLPGAWSRTHPKFLLPVAALLALVIGWHRYRRLKHAVFTYGLGAAGEESVAETLEQLVPFGCAVFHDLPGPRGNIDHVVVSPHTVFVIETKTRRKPEGDARVSSRAGTLLINGVQTEAPITQSLACATEVRKRVESNGLQHATQPVLVFPGWFVDPMPTPWPPVWIMNPIGLQRFVQRTCRADPGARPSAALVSIFDAWAREPDPESLA